MIEEAITRANAAAIEQAGLPDEARPTLPTIISEESGKSSSLLIAWHFADAPNTNQARQVWFPVLEARVSLPRLIATMREIEPADYNLNLDISKPIGTLADMAARPYDLYSEALGRYRQLLDLIAAQNLLSVQSADTQQIKNIFAEIRDVLTIISEEALEIYYQKAHQELRTAILNAGFPFLR